MPYADKYIYLISLTFSLLYLIRARVLKLRAINGWIYYLSCAVVSFCVTD